MTATVPMTLAEAVAVRAARPEATVVAGGTDLLPALRTGRLPAAPAAWLSLHAVAELAGVADAGPARPAVIAGDLTSHSDAKAPTIGGRLRIGAGTTVAAVEREPLIARYAAALRDAAALIGSPATRTVATVGGNLVNGSPAMELGAPLLALGATVELASVDGRRRVPLADFLLGPGRVDLRPGELLVAVELDGAGAAGSPAVPAGAGDGAPAGRTTAVRPPAGSAYVRIDGRAAMEVALAGAAAAVELNADGATVVAARIALCAVAPTCRRAPAAERLLTGRRPALELLDAVAQEAAAAAEPIDDHRAPADYRRAVVAVAVRRALDAALARAAAAPAPPATATLAPPAPAPDSGGDATEAGR